MPSLLSHQLFLNLFTDRHFLVLHNSKIVASARATSNPSTSTDILYDTYLHSCSILCMLAQSWANTNTAHKANEFIKLYTLYRSSTKTWADATHCLFVLWRIVYYRTALQDWQLQMYLCKPFLKIIISLSLSNNSGTIKTVLYASRSKQYSFSHTTHTFTYVWSHLKEVWATSVLLTNASQLFL